MLKKEQQNVIDSVNAGDNIFLSGGAGTGKSYVLNEIIKNLHKKHKNVLVTASTGIAAVQNGGVTLHRAFQIPFGPCPDSQSYIPKAVYTADVIIIDEISMCRVDTFEYIADVIFRVEAKSHRNIQLIVCGDFCQLAPVVTKAEEGCLSQRYNGVYAFEAPSWDAFDFKTIILNEVVRQKDVDFSHMLNELRFGDGKNLNVLYKRSAKKDIEDAITLYATNKKAEEHNELALRNLNQPIVYFTARVEGKVSPSERPVPESLGLAKGCRVMFAINDAEDRFVNGTFGTVTSVTKKKCMVKIDDGPTVQVLPHEWTINKYETQWNEDTLRDEIVSVKIGSYYQLPLRLAYAITMHKSQGQTYEKANIEPFCFAEGQLYVALSRVKSINNLHFIYPPAPKYLITDSKVTEFYKNLIETEEALKE